MSENITENVEETTLEKIVKTSATVGASYTPPAGEEMMPIVNVFKFTSVNGDNIELEYNSVWYIENNGLELFVDAAKYNVNDLSVLFPSTPFEGNLAVKDVENSIFSYHSNLICRRISLEVPSNEIKISLPGITEEAKRYMELQTQIEQLQANLDYVAMETEVEL